MSKISRAQRIKQLGSRLGSITFPEFQKSGEKTRKSPEILRFRELFLAEKERFTNRTQAEESGLTLKNGVQTKQFRRQSGVSRLTGYQTDQPRQKENPTLTGRVLFLAEKERFELSRRYSRPTPLAGAPLRPLEYFSKYSSEAAVCMGFRTFLLYYILRRLSSLFR